MYRITLKKAHGFEEVTYRRSMSISDLFKDKEVLSASIAVENLKNYHDELQHLISNLPTKNFDGHTYRLAEFADIEKMKGNPSVYRVDFIKTCDGHALFAMLYSDEYGYDISSLFAVRV